MADRADAAQRLPRRLALGLLLLQALSWRDAPAGEPPWPGRRVLAPSPLPVDPAWLLAWLDRVQPDTPVFRVDQRVERAASLQATRRVLLASFAAQQLAAPDERYVREYVGSVLENRVAQRTLRAMAERQGKAAPAPAVARRSYDLFHQIERSGGQQPGPDELDERASESLLAEALLDDELRPSDDELLLLYQQQRGRLALRDGLWLHELLVPLAPWPPRPGRDAPEPAAQQRARALADELRPLPPDARAERAQALAQGAEVARSSWIEADQLPPPLRSALDAAPLDTLVGPLRSRLGLHIAWVSRRERDITPPFDQLRPRVVELWKTERREAARRRLVEQGLRQHAVWMLVPDPPEP